MKSELLGTVSGGHKMSTSPRFSEREASVWMLRFSQFGRLKVTSPGFSEPEASAVVQLLSWCVISSLLTLPLGRVGP